MGGPRPEVPSRRLRVFDNLCETVAKQEDSESKSRKATSSAESRSSAMVSW